MVKKGAIPWAELKAKEIALNCDGSKSSVFGEMSKLAPPELLGALENRAASLQRQGAAEVYLKEFPYGQVVAQQGELIEEIIEGEGLEIPFGILLDGCIEIFEPADISKDAIANPLISNSRAKNPTIWEVDRPIRGSEPDLSAATRRRQLVHRVRCAHNLLLGKLSDEPGGEYEEVHK